MFHVKQFNRYVSRETLFFISCDKTVNIFL